MKESAKEFIKRKNKEFEGKKLIGMKDITRKKRNYFVREAWTFMLEHKEKVFIIERLKNRENNKICYRIGYYIVGKIRRAKNKWVWGQFCPMIPQKDFKKLFEKAKKEKTII